MNTRGSTVAKVHTYNADKGNWSAWEDVLFRSSHPTHSQSSWAYELPFGGTVRVHPHLIDSTVQKQIMSELLDNSHLFRQYTVQASPKPRAHFLAHPRLLLTGTNRNRGMSTMT